jgi:hypothetical protein
MRFRDWPILFISLLVLASAVSVGRLRRGNG